jgi:hypothetical protein
MASRDLWTRWYRSNFGIFRAISAVMLLVGSVGALGAFLEATIGAGHYTLQDAVNCLALAAIGLVLWFVAPTVLRIVSEAFREASK